MKASKEFQCDNLLIITDHYENEEKIGKYNLERKIKFLPLWKWLLKKTSKE